MMSTTPGPWQAKDDYTREGRFTIIAPTDIDAFEHVATLTDEFDETHERTVANRQAIIAVPDLIDALSLIREATMRSGDKDALRSALDTIQLRADAALKLAGVL